MQQWLGENPDEEEEESNPCPICNSAEREDILLLCDGCDTAYHTHCIGIDHIPEGDWYCMECAHLFQLTNEQPESGAASETSPRPQTARRPTARANRGFHVRTRARLRRARRQARNMEWQGAWGQFSGRFYEMSELDLDNHDDEDEDLERFRRFQQLDRRELQRWQQRINIAQRLGARESFASNIPPQISERLQPPLPPIEETRDERRAWGALDRAREADGSSPSTRKRKARSVTASPVEQPAQEPERKLKRPRTRRLPTHGESSAATALPAAAGPSSARLPNGTSLRSNTASSTNQDNAEPTLVVSSLLKELEPNAHSEDETSGAASGWRPFHEASSPALSPSPSAFSSPRALSLTPPPLPNLNGRPSSPTLSLSTHIEPVYPPANYSPTNYSPTRFSSSDHSDSESLPIKLELRNGGRNENRLESRPLELRQPRPRRAHEMSPESSPTRGGDDNSMRHTMTTEEKKSVNDIVRNALRPHWRAQKLTVEQYATINRDISRKLYDEVKDASSLDDETRRQTWEKRVTQEVARAISELQA